MKRIAILAALLGGVFVGGIAAAPDASATTLLTTTTIDFTANASEFAAIHIPGGGPGSGTPFSTLSGTITVVYDPTQSYDGTEGSEITGFSFTTPSGATFNPTGPATFSYLPDLGGTPDMGVNLGDTIGADLFSITMVEFVANGTGAAQILYLTSLFPHTGFGQLEPKTAYSATSFTTAVATTPIPGSLLMLMTALLGGGGLVYLQRRRAAGAMFAA